MKRICLYIVVSVCCIFSSVVTTLAKETSEDNHLISIETSNDIKDTKSVNLSSVENLKAVSAGKNQVKLSWSSVPGAQEYIIYRQVGDGKFSYRYITKNLTYVDMTASGTEYNFYRVYPCYTNELGTRIVGQSNKYVYAKATLSAVDNLQAMPDGKNTVKITWNKVEGAEGYIIYRQIGKSTFSYLYVTSNSSYIDMKASDIDFNFYRVYPYYKQDGKNVIGTSKSYVYAKGVLEAVKGFEAQVVGKSIKLTWDKVSGAEGYIIYRQIGNSSFKYLYIKDANSTSYVDSKCDGAEYNFYRVYPYHKNSGNMIPGLSDKYVYGKLVLEPVNNIICRSTNYKEITLRWEQPQGAEGYFVLRGIGEAQPQIIGVLENRNITKFVDSFASEQENNYYAIIPYFVDGQGSTIVTNIEVITSEIAIGIKMDTMLVSVSGYESYTDAYRVLERVNEERSKVGLESLVMDKDLLEAAMQRAAELVVLFSHTRPSGLDCSTVEIKMYGENIAGGYSSPEMVMEGWMNSSGHRNNILGKGYKSIGIGCFKYNGVTYWVQLFGYDMITTTVKPSDGNNTRLLSVASNLLVSNMNESEKKNVTNIETFELLQKNQLVDEENIGKFSQTVMELGKVNMHCWYK